ncbi:monocarboxylate transporter 5 [Octopus bimaculoides]|nr:monocarboxylate transporter 5 [Octopus bimaculoides]
MWVYVEHLLSPLGRVQLSSETIIKTVAPFSFDKEGVLTGCFSSKYGVRSTALLGSFLLCLGLGISVCVSNVGSLIIYLGLVAGSGTSFIFIAINCGIASYFDQSSRQLMSLISTGGAVGAIIFPIFVSKLTELYSWRGSLLLLCAFTMHTVPCGLLYSLKKLPRKWAPPVSNEVRNGSCSRSYQSTDKTPQEHFASPKKTKFNLDQVSNDSDESDSKPQMEIAHETDEANASSRHENNNHLKGINMCQSNDMSGHEEETDTKLSQIRMLSMILNSNTYLLLLLSTTGAVSFIMSFAMILPDYLVNRGMTLEESTRIFVLASVGNIAARFITCWLLYKNIASGIMIFNLSGLSGAALALLYPYFTSTSMLILLSFMIFLASGLGLSVFSVTFLEIFENKLYSCALGFSMTLSGLGLPLSGYIISVLKDRYESYVPCYHFLALLCCFTIVPSIIHALVTKWKRNTDSVV